MYQQPLADTVSTEQFFRSLNAPPGEDRKLTFRDVLLTLAEVASVLALCSGLHIAFA